MPTDEQIEKAARAGDPDAFRRMESAFEMAEKWRAALDIETNTDDRDDIAKMMADCEHKGASAKEKLFDKYRAALAAALSAAEPVKVREYGPETEAVIQRDRFHIDVEWYVRGVKLKARVYEPQMMPLSPALADVLALALEQRPIRSALEGT